MERHLQTNHDQVMITTVKSASRGSGIIVRMLSYALASTMVRLSCSQRNICKACLCDARERDIGELEVEEGAALIPVTGTLTTVRLLY